MKNETRSPQEILVGIKLGDSFTPNKDVCITWGVHEGKHTVILAEKITLDGKVEYRTSALTNHEALEKIATYVFNQ